MEEISEKIDNLLVKFQSLDRNVSGINSRLSAVEEIQQNSAGCEENEHFSRSRDPGYRQDGHLLMSGNDQGLNPPSSELDLSISTEDIQGEFRRVKDSYTKVTLPPEIRLNAERVGIKREDQPKYNILVNSAKYSETVLKIIAASKGQVNAENTAQIITCLTAHQQFLKDEYSNLLVKTNFNQETANLFRHLQRNQSAFPQSAISNLQSAATIAAATQQFQHHNRGRGFRGRFRGQYRRGRGSTDVYNNFTSQPFQAQPHNNDNE